MDLEELKSCRDNLLKEAARLSKIINYNSSYSMSFDEMLLLYECEIVNTDVVDTTYLMQLIERDKRPLHGRTIGFMLKSIGYLPIASRKIKINGNCHYLWVNRATITDHQATSIVRKYYNKKAPA